MTKFETENDLRLTIKAEEKEILVDEVCCTSVNIILKNDGQIMTSFLGAHNPEIIRNLEKALKLYFKGIRKTLKAKQNEHDCCCGEEHCHSECHDKECSCEKGHCDCHEHDHECDCGDHCECYDPKEDVSKVKANSKTKSSSTKKTASTKKSNTKK